MPNIVLRHPLGAREIGRSVARFGAIGSARCWGDSKAVQRRRPSRRRSPATPETSRTGSRAPRRKGRQKTPKWCRPIRPSPLVRRVRRWPRWCRRTPRLGNPSWAAQQRHLGEVQSLRRLAQIVELRANSNPVDRRPRHQGDNLVELLLGFDADDPDLPIGQQLPCRIHVDAVQLRSDGRQRLDMIGANLGGNDHKRTILWQPKIAGDLAQTAVVADSALKQRVDQQPAPRGVMAGRCPEVVSRRRRRIDQPAGLPLRRIRATDRRRL
jgi:hypothetical protein